MFKLSHGVLLTAAASLTLGAASAQQEPNRNYPLRLHVLAVDETHRTARLQPNWCSTSIPNFGADPGAAQADPCSSGGATLTFSDSDGFSGTGRADLVTLPAGTQALSFSYEGCSRVRVPTGFQGLFARWKKPGKLEVLIPSDSISVATPTPPAQRCTLTVAMHEFVYLRLKDGSLLRVSQEAFARKPALRVFLSGGSEILQPRVSPTVSVKQLTTSHP